MTVVQQIAIYLSAVAALWGLAAGAFGLIAILRSRNRWYTAQHVGFLDRKQRVEQDLKRGRND